MTHKRNVAAALSDRAIAFTNPHDRPKSIEKVKEILAGNGYPNDFISKVIRNRVDKFYNNRTIRDPDPKRYIAAPYIPGLSERLKKSLNDHGLTLSCKTKNKIGNLYSRTKYTIPKEQKSKVVYEVKCSECSETKT